MEVRYYCRMVCFEIYVSTVGVMVVVLRLLLQYGFGLFALWMKARVLLEKNRLSVLGDCGPLAKAPSRSVENFKILVFLLKY